MTMASSSTFTSRDGRRIELPAGVELELYDLQKDPEQLTNLAGDPAAASLLANLQQRLAGLKECSGDTCRAGQP